MGLNIRRDLMEIKRLKVKKTYEKKKRREDESTREEKN